MKLFLLYFFFLPAFFVSAFGQTTPAAARPTMPLGTPVSASHPAAAAASTAAPDYSAEPAVVERLDTVIRMNADGTGSREAMMVVRIQSEAAVKQLGVLIVPYAANTEKVEIAYLRVRRPDGTVIDTPVSEAMDMPNPVTREAPFYSDLKQIELPVRNLDVGDTLEWKVTVVQSKALAPGQFWGQESFDDSTVILSQSVELHVPANIYVNVWSPTVKPAVTEAGGEKVYRWTYSQKKPTAGKLADAARALKAKQVWTAAQELDAKEGKLPTIAWTTFKSWKAVGAWYRGLEADRILPDATVKAKVAELTANQPTQEDKIRAVYGYVSTQVRYIGVAFGVGRYQPHPAQEVLQNQYGDCKDKGTLLAAMLNALGLHPDVALIGAGVRFNAAVPSPASFNHLINRVSVDGREVWLDSTSGVAPYRVLFYVTRGKQALVIPGDGTASIQRTPDTLPFPYSGTMNAVGTLDKDGISHSRIEFTFRGDDELILRNAFRQVSPAMYDQLVQRFSQAIGYAGTVSNSVVTNLENTALPLGLNYDYKREKAGDWANYRIIPQLAPIEAPAVSDVDPPVRAIELGVPRVETSTSAMKLPAGWGVVLPAAVHTKSPYITYDETYRFQDGTVYAKRRVEILRETVPVADWKTYQKWTEAASLDKQTYIQLTNTGVGNSGANAAPAAKDDPEASRLVYSAYTALQMRAFDTAQEMLDKAKALNPSQSGLWVEYAYLAAVHGDNEGAVSDYKQELSSHPDSAEAWHGLTTAYVRLHQPDNADDAVRKWAAADAANPMPYRFLIGLLVRQGKAAAAVAAGEAAIAKLPADKKNDVNLQFALGHAEFAAGMKDKGRATFVALLKAGQDPETMNNCAYELAVANVELPLAESKARSALQRMETESRTWNLDGAPSSLLGKSNLIVATWDTMGWILYREGKLNQSEGYLKAAWNSGQSFTIARHLGEVEEALGRKDAALNMYELALATIPRHVGMGGANPTPSPDEIEVRNRIVALKKAGAKSTTKHPTQALQSMRTFSLGPRGGSKGSAQYWVLIGDGAVSQIKAIGQDNVQDGAERVKQIKFSGFFPPASNANLLRKGILFCGLAGCQFVLEP